MMMCLPAAAARMANSWCSAGGVQISMASISGRAKRASKSVVTKGILASAASGAAESSVREQRPRISTEPGGSAA